MAKFGQMLLNEGSYGEMQYFRPETFEKMLPDKLTGILGADVKRTFGIGLDGNRERFGHGAASAATFSVDRKERLIVIMTRNRIGKNYERFNGKFWQAIQGGMIPKGTEKGYRRDQPGGALAWDAWELSDASTRLTFERRLSRWFE